MTSTTHPFNLQLTPTASIQLDAKQCQQLHPQTTLAQPLSIVLPGALPAVSLTEILRVVPGTRCVAKGWWQSTRVIVKLFYHSRKYAKHCHREVEGLTQISMAGIACPQPLYSGRLANDPHVSVLITPYIDSPTLSEVWRYLDDTASRLRCFDKLLSVIMQLANANCLYNDCHLDNFLLYNQDIVLLDGSAVVNQKRPITLKQLCQQMISLSTQATDLEQKLVFERITNVLPSVPDLTSYLALMYQQWQYERQNALLNKTLRPSTKHSRLHHGLLFGVGCRTLCNTAAFKQWLADPDGMMQQGQSIKQGQSNTVVKLQLDKYSVIVKRYNIKHWRHRLKRLFRRSRARTAWLNAALLRHHNIATPTPIAFVERKRWRWFTQESYYLYDYLPGERADTLLTDVDCPPARKRAVCANLVKLIQQLEQAHVVHGDLKASNFLVDDEDNVSLLDLDALYWQPNPKRFAQQHLADRRRFMQNWCRYPELSQQFQPLWQQGLSMMQPV